MKKAAVRITDLRTDREYELPIEHGAIPAIGLRQIKVDDDDFGLMTYDPAYQNTAACKSYITDIDGDRGILRYRGYPIEELAEKSSFLEVCYLLIEGDLPSASELDAFRAEISEHMHVPDGIEKLFDGFGREAHLMGILCSSLPALGTYYPDSRDVLDAASRRLQIVRAIAKMPILAGFAFRHWKGEEFVNPDPSLSYSGSFLRQIFGTKGQPYEPNPILERALDILFILHADHEQNCSTSVMRGIGSSQAGPFAALGGAAAALWGPLHGGANEAVLRMLREIGTKDAIPAYVESAKNGERRLMGFGHRIYKNYDPRATIIKELAHEVFEVQGENPLLDIARELERIALSDDYFVSRKLYPNVDFYSGLIYESLGFPSDFFTVLFAIGRTPGWLSQWHELMGDSEQKIARPRQLYLGEGKRPYSG